MLNLLRWAGDGEGSEWEGNERREITFTGGKEIGIFRLQSLVDCLFISGSVTFE
jgi:hypothetical protein